MEEIDYKLMLLVKNRIQTEHSKHSDKDWEEIAARKIVRSLKYLYTLTEKNTDHKLK